MAAGRSDEDLSESWTPSLVEFVCCVSESGTPFQRQVMRRMPEQEIPRLDLYRRIVQAKLFIDARFAESIDASDIADEACYSKYHFIRTFRSIYGKTPHQHLIAVRLGRARELLELGMSVTDVSSSVGFESLGSFIALFKRRTGCTPSVYQRERLARQQQVADAPLSFVPGCFAAMVSRDASRHAE